MAVALAAPDGSPNISQPAAPKLAFLQILKFLFLMEVLKDGSQAVSNTPFTWMHISQITGDS
jgi:hypothetical protein